MHEPGIRSWPRLADVRARATAPFAAPAPELTGFLSELILPSAYDAGRGTYIPLTHKVSLFAGTIAYRSKRTAKKFKYLGSEILRAPLNPCLFANGLLIPEALGTPFFDTRSALPPKATATNIGFVAATLEIDCETRDELDRLLAQIPLSDESDEAYPAHALHLLMHEIPEYLGCCIVFSGRRSVHFHFAFSTRHLLAAPFEADARERTTPGRTHESALMHAVHRAYWDRAASGFAAVFDRTPPLDQALRTITQYRRVPWGVRKLEQPAELLDLAAGIRVVQLVLFERMRKQPAAGGTSDHLVPPDFRDFN